MSFRREDFFGIDFSWFCYDGLGMIGELVTGYGPIPAQVFDDKSSYGRVLDYFSELPDTSSSELSNSTKARARRGRSDFTLFLNRSRKGLFVYDYKGHHGPYERISIPRVPLLIAQLPDDVRRELVEIPNVLSEDETIAL